MCFYSGVTSEDWSTLAGLREVSRVRSGRIPGWSAPVAYAVGFFDGREWKFPYVNRPGGTHDLPAVMLAEVVGYGGGTHEFHLTAEQLAIAIAKLAPAEAVSDVDHPNLMSWRSIAAAAPSQIAAVFVGSLEDQPAGNADVALRLLLV
ncbi:hypothetical protein MPRG_65770 [Mycobacterium paragordonae]|uniref:Uncharacterized protein n=1 Tax=Mycobacterium paragordonae TaxID=1389713 RepID=A0ABQ1CFM5_9MYCO|nr:hypothetical protein MPRG_65770 [Mycobacterium paragordonae]